MRKPLDDFDRAFVERRWIHAHVDGNVTEEIEVLALCCAATPIHGHPFMRYPAYMYAIQNRFWVWVVMTVISSLAPKVPWGRCSH